MQSPDESLADTALLDRIVGRDAAALGLLYDRHSRVVFGLILRILKDRAEAEEVLQEVFFLVWTRAETYNVALGPPAGWLVRIGRNRAIDRLRANNVRTRAVEAASAPGQSADSPEIWATANERRLAVTHALEALSPEQRHLIEQAYFLGLTQAELADRFQMPLGTVKTRMRSGMLALRQQLSRWSGNDARS